MAQAQGLADFLLPDVLTYDTATKARAALNGRALCRRRHRRRARDHDQRLRDERRRRARTADYLAVFPYLGVPHP